MYCFFSSPPRLSAAVIGVFLPSTAFSIVLLYRRSLQAALKGSPPSKFLLVILCVVPAGSLHLLLCGEREGCWFLYYAFSAYCAVYSVLCIQYTLRIALCTQYSAVVPPLRLRFLLFSSSARETRNSKLETRDGRFGKREDFGFYRSS